MTSSRITDETPDDLARVRQIEALVAALDEAATRVRAVAAAAERDLGTISARLAEDAALRDALRLAAAELAAIEERIGGASARAEIIERATALRADLTRLGDEQTALAGALASARSEVASLAAAVSAERQDLAEWTRTVRVELEQQLLGILTERPRPAAPALDAPGHASESPLSECDVPPISPVTCLAASSGASNAPEPRGRALFVRTCREAAAELARPDADVAAVLSRAALRIGRTRFEPVLVYYLLSRSAEPIPPALEADTSWNTAGVLFDFLDGLADGEGAHPRTFARFVRGMNADHHPRTEGLFRILGAAVQLLAFEEEEGAESTNGRWRIAFELADGLIAATAPRRDDIPAHIAHFRLHAAVFLSTTTSTDTLEDVRIRAAERLVSWGDPVPYDAVVAHAAGNMNFGPNVGHHNDAAYDLVRRLRKDVATGTLQESDALIQLDETLGWSLANRILAVLWHGTVRRHYLGARERLTRCLSERGGAAARLEGKRLGIVGQDGRVLLPGSDASSEDDQQRVVWFPAGASIGRSCIACSFPEARLLLDFGSDPFGRTAPWFPELELVRGVVVTHAHLDHIGGLLRLYGELGFDGPWYAHPANERIAALVLRDAVTVSASRTDSPYTEKTVARIMEHFEPIRPGETKSLGSGLDFTFFDAGHVSGSVQVLVRAGDTRLWYTGDFNPAPTLSVDVLQLPPKDVLESIDTLVVEGTNAFRNETITDADKAPQQLIDEITELLPGPVLVPVMSLGRAQEVVAALGGTDLRVGLFGLASKVTAAIGPLPRNVTAYRGSVEFLRPDTFDVLVASAGCLQGGPSQYLYSDSMISGTILTGYVFPGTPAFRDLATLRLVRFSAHATESDWLRFMEHFPNATRYLVHFPGDRARAREAGFVVPQPERLYPMQPASTTLSCAE